MSVSVSRYALNESTFSLCDLRASLRTWSWSCVSEERYVPASDALLRIFALPWLPYAQAQASARRASPTTCPCPWRAHRLPHAPPPRCSTFSFFYVSFVTYFLSSPFNFNAPPGLNAYGDDITLSRPPEWSCGVELEGNYVMQLPRNEAGPTRLCVLRLVCFPVAASVLVLVYSQVRLLNDLRQSPTVRTRWCLFC